MYEILDVLYVIICSYFANIITVSDFSKIRLYIRLQIQSELLEPNTPKEFLNSNKFMLTLFFEYVLK